MRCGWIFRWQRTSLDGVFDRLLTFDTQQLLAPVRQNLLNRSGMPCFLRFGEPRNL